MKPALLLLAAAIVGAAGCTNNDISLSIIQMQAITRANMCIAMPGATAHRDAQPRHARRLAWSRPRAIIAVPVVRNNLVMSTTGVDYNSIQVIGANVTLTVGRRLGAAAAGGADRLLLRVGGRPARSHGRRRRCSSSSSTPTSRTRWPP